MTARDDKDREKTGRENLGKFFYDIAKTTFTVMVLGSAMAIFGITEMNINAIFSLLCGGICTAIFAFLGNRVFNKK